MVPEVTAGMRWKGGIYRSLWSLHSARIEKLDGCCSGNWGRWGIQACSADAVLLHSMMFMGCGDDMYLDEV